jgi:hypothetical protein
LAYVELTLIESLADPEVDLEPMLGMAEQRSRKMVDIKDGKGVAKTMNAR